MPKQGPSEGSRRVQIAFLPILRRPIDRPDVGGGLALAGRGGRDGGAEHQLAVRAVFETIEDVQVDLGLVLAVEVQIVRAQPQAGGDLGDRDHCRFACDLDIALHAPRSFEFRGG